MTRISRAANPKLNIRKADASQYPDMTISHHSYNSARSISLELMTDTIASTPLSLNSAPVSSSLWSWPPNNNQQALSSSDFKFVQPRPSFKRHDGFYFSDGNVIFLVQGTLYNVHRLFFLRYSTDFSSRLSLQFGGRGQGFSDEEAICLPGVSVHDFDLFLSMFYPSAIGVYTAVTVEEWTSILRLADEWSFRSIKLLAIEKLAEIASPIDKVVLGRRYDIFDWLSDAYCSICSRKAPLTEEEGQRLGVGDVIKIAALRQGKFNSEFSPVEDLNIMKERFGLHDISKTSTTRVAEGLGDNQAWVQSATSDTTDSKTATPSAPNPQTMESKQHAIRSRDTDGSTGRFICLECDGYGLCIPDNPSHSECSSCPKCDGSGLTENPPETCDSDDGDRTHCSTCLQHICRCGDSEVQKSATCDLPHFPHIELSSLPPASHCLTCEHPSKHCVCENEVSGNYIRPRQFLDKMAMKGKKGKKGKKGRRDRVDRLS